MNTFIKTIFLFSIGFYTYFDLNNYKYSVLNFIKVIVFATISAAFATLISVKLSTIYFPAILPLYFLALLSFSHSGKYTFSFIYAIISISIPYSVYSILSIPISLIFVALFSTKIFIYTSYLSLIAEILTIFTIIILMKSKRFAKAIHLICNYNNFYIIAILTFSILFIIAVAQSQTEYTSDDKIYSIGLILIALILLYIIQRQTQKYYLAKLKKLELESLRQELAEKDALIQKLQESNDSLARIIHKDNKLIPSMASAVNRYLHNVNTLDADALRASGATLAKELELLAQSRQGILTTYEDLKDGLPHSGFAGVDAILLHMRDRALALHIDYSVTLSAAFADSINRLISEADLTHLLADLIENAMVATKESGARVVLVQLGILHGAPAVEISDSGKPFDPAVYQDFGLQKHSTHLEDGGSGIGLMDIWELKKKYAASLHIHEYAPAATHYTKKLSIVFDRKNHYLIRTYRPQELLEYRTRTDMYVLPPE